MREDGVSMGTRAFSGCRQVSIWVGCVRGLRTAYASMWAFDLGEPYIIVIILFIQ